ncbi:cytochrome bd oxidase small subunit CydS [Paenibacillus thiaminolyticus]
MKIITPFAAPLMIAALSIVAVFWWGARAKRYED